MASSATPSPFGNPVATTGPERLPGISRARQAVLYGHGALTSAAPGVDSWIERSWQRCLANGHSPSSTPVFDTVSAPALRRTLNANHALIQAASPILERLGQAIAGTRYFAILTNREGIVVDVHGAIDRSDRRADLITRIGTDLSENQLATTAIGAALAELQPVWLHRGEHFFEANSAYSCAGAPLFGPDGRCIGMLDLTGIEVAERPELKHLVAQSARGIENALALRKLRGSRDLLVRLNWPGHALGSEADGLVCLDADGYVLGANQMARQMVPQLVAGPLPPPGQAGAPPLHCSDLFAMAFEMLYDAAHRNASLQTRPLELPLWTGLRLQALPVLHGHRQSPAGMQRQKPATEQQPLRELENALIRQAVDNARGNVLQAARALGISRATVYRRLGAGIKRR